MAKSVWFMLSVVCAFSVLESAGDEPKPELNGWLKHYKEVAKTYDIRLKSKLDEPLVLIPEPVQVYSNPSSGRDTHGAFFIWTLNGRAEVIGAIWSRLSSESPDSQRFINHEFHSLAIEPLAAIRKNRKEWTPETAGIELKPIPDAPVPGTSPRQLLTQMKILAQQFSGYTLYPRGAATPSEVKMKLLPTPLYRYTMGQSESEVMDGAVFGMFVDWDPQIILVIEVRNTANGKSWQYGIAHLDNKSLWLQHNGVAVWTKSDTSLGSPAANYYARIGVEVLPNVAK